MAVAAPQIAIFEQARRTTPVDGSPRKTPALAHPSVKQFVDGEGFAYLGRGYRLLLDEHPESTSIAAGSGCHPTDTARFGAEAMRPW